MSELKDCPLQFHDFKSVDHLKVCPRYTAVLARSEDDGIGIEELDTLQLELETLLSSASRRLRVLEAETQVRGEPHRMEILSVMAPNTGVVYAKIKAPFFTRAHSWYEAFYANSTAFVVPWSVFVRCGPYWAEELFHR